MKGKHRRSLSGEDSTRFADNHCFGQTDLEEDLYSNPQYAEGDSALIIAPNYAGPISRL